jgi:hypothetical protein
MFVFAPRFAPGVAVHPLGDDAAVNGAAGERFGFHDGVLGQGRIARQNAAIEAGIRYVFAFGFTQSGEGDRPLRTDNRLGLTGGEPSGEQGGDFADLGGALL